MIYVNFLNLIYRSFQHNLAAKYGKKKYILANSYEYLQSHSYIFVRFAFMTVMLGLGAMLQYCFFLEK